MSPAVLEVTFRKGRPLAAYLHLSAPKRRARDTRRVAKGLVGDFGSRGDLLGIEILAFDKATLKRINEVLVAYKAPKLSASDLAPLRRG